MEIRISGEIMINRIAITKEFSLKKISSNASFFRESPIMLHFFSNRLCLFYSQNLRNFNFNPFFFWSISDDNSPLSLLLIFFHERLMNSCVHRCFIQDTKDGSLRPMKHSIFSYSLGYFLLSSPFKRQGWWSNTVFRIFLCDSTKTHVFYQK